VQAQTRIAVAPLKPVLIYDGDCAFCSFWIRRWQQITGDRVEYLPFQAGQVASRFSELALPQLAQSVHLVQTDGSVFSGAEAALRALALGNRATWALPLYLRSSVARGSAEGAYRFVADHRSFFSFLTRFWWGNRLEPTTYILTHSILIRLLALTYLIAFMSLWSQVNGLIGKRGILPATQTIEALRNHAETAGIKLDRYRLFPTFCWFDATDRFLNLQCAAGVSLAGLVILGVGPAPCLFLLWLIYLSLCTISREFLGFQWDNLLLETGFLAIFLAPLRFLPWRTYASSSRPSTLVIWLFRWLLFRLLFESGCVKLLSQDESWSNLTALTFHYETQPLPTSIAWHVHQLPIWMHKASCFLMFAVELIFPFFIFGPRRLRHLTGLIFIAFQVGIFLTGNYCFFNLLMIVLCVSLFDDEALRAVALKLRIPGPRAVLGSQQQRKQGGVQIHSALPAESNTLRAEDGSRSGLWKGFMRLAVALLVLLLTVPQLFHMLGNRSRPQFASNAMQEWFAPFRTFNSYGLFAVMTRPRYEIIVQGSSDGQNWLDYEFKYKPGDPRRRPGFVAPHQPRLDWQMWFAALGDYRNNPWFVQFCGRLLQNSPDVLSLLKTNPFPGGAPRYIRAQFYEYHFTDRRTRRATGAWWQREFKGDYLPPLSLRPD